MTTPAAPRASNLRRWLGWTAGFLAFPIAGLAGTGVAGRVDDPLAALLGGAIALRIRHYGHHRQSDFVLQRPTP